MTPEYAKAVQVLIRKVYEAHDACDSSDVDALVTEARRLGVDAPDVLRRLADLRRWKIEAGR